MEDITMDKNASHNIVTTEENTPFPISLALLIAVMILAIVILGLKMMGAF
jgi:hypothetical protein